MFKRLPEDAERLAAFRRALKGGEQQAIEAVALARESLAKDGLHLLENPGVPLRPLFLSRARLDAICTTLHQNALTLGRALAEHLRDPEAQAELFPFPTEYLEATATPGLLTGEQFASILRPDGFLYGDHFAMTEPNHANGYLISATYPEAVATVFEQLPALKDFSVPQRVQRPLRGIFAWLKRQLPARSRRGRARLALFWHREEEAIIRDWNERTQGILAWLPRALERDGWDVVFSREDELDVNKAGHCIHTTTKQRVDLVLQIPIGTHFLYTPERFATDWKNLRGTHVGDAPFLQPLAHVAVDKGTMPLWQTLPGWGEVRDGFRVDTVPTHYPSHERAREYRVEREKWVLKRSFEGKDTHVGIGAMSRVWNRALQTALETREYIMQPYLQMSVAEIPVIQNDRVEWVDSAVELSLFIIDGKWSGGFARFLPAGDGHVLSPPPPGMGFTLVYDCP